MSEHNFCQECHDDDGLARRIENLVLHGPQNHGSFENLKAPEIYDLTEDAEEQDDLEILEMVDLTDDDDDNHAHLHHEESYGIDDVVIDGFKIEVGTTVEIFPCENKLPDSSTFLRVTYIFRDALGKRWIRGLPYTRTRNFKNKLPKKKNEVCLILNVVSGDSRSDEEQSTIDLPLEIETGDGAMPRTLIRRCLIHTNASYPKHSFQRSRWANRQEAEDNAELICRWKQRCVWLDSKYRNLIDVALLRLSEIDKNIIPEPYYDCRNHLLWAWRGGKIRGGSHVVPKPDVMAEDATMNAVVLDDDDTDVMEIPEKQKYTMADMFSGAGGASCGAQDAGFFVETAVDFNKPACVTHRMNFPSCNLYETHISWFITKIDLKDYVDVLHLSPPCQFWSPAHTVPGKNDEANIATLFSCHELVKKLRPRIFTLEQTFGILRGGFRPYFNSLIQGFTQHGYSVRWTKKQLLEYGSPSQRLRLIMIGACPGEPLPEFPPATHSSLKNPTSGPKASPFVSVREALEPLVQRSARSARSDPLHDVRSVLQRNSLSWDPGHPLRCIIKTRGSDLPHFDGTREFTLRELALLQGFPVDFRFQEPEVKKQIGNAFPPCVVRVLYTHIRRSLEESDRVRIASPPVIDIEVDEDDDVQVAAWRSVRHHSDCSEA